MFRTPRVAALTSTLLVIASSVAEATADPESLRVTDRRVRCVERQGDRLFIGGDFEYVGPRTHLAALDAATGAALPGAPSGSLGFVHAIDGSGDTVFSGGLSGARAYRASTGAELADWG